MTVAKEYTVVSLRASINEGVELELSPIFKLEVTREEPTLRPEQVIVGPAPKTEDEKVMQGMVKSVVQEFQRLGVMPPTRQTATPPPLRPIPYFYIYLTKEEYEQLKPAIGQTITLILATKGESNV